MRECWPEGSLRAYHDGELPLVDMGRLSAHLAECADCEALADEIAARATRVAALLSALPEPEQVIWMPRRTGVSARRVPAGRWAASAIALAAGLALIMWLAPKRSGLPPAPVAKVAPAPVQAVELPVVKPAQTVQMAAPRGPVRRSLPTRVFFALDDEPIETGVVVRVALGPEEIPADVVFGADGRAHAIRLVSNRSKN